MSAASIPSACSCATSAFSITLWSVFPISRNNLITSMRTRLFPIFLALSVSVPFVSFELAKAQRQPQLLAAAEPATANIPAPQEVLGFTPGDDRKLASWSQVLKY